VTQNADTGAWWRDHPAYDAIVETFRSARINNGPHLAFILLAGLRARGYEVSPNGSSEAQ
jgi:hypothetical protein